MEYADHEAMCRYEEQAAYQAYLEQKNELIIEYNNNLFEINQTIKKHEKEITKLRIQASELIRMLNEL